MDVSTSLRSTVLATTLAFPILLSCSDGVGPPMEPDFPADWVHDAVPANLVPVMEDLRDRIIPSLNEAGLAAPYEDLARELRAGWELNQPQRIRDALLAAATTAGRQLNGQAGAAAPDVGVVILVLHGVAGHVGLPGGFISAAVEAGGA